MSQRFSPRVLPAVPVVVSLLACGRDGGNLRPAPLNDDPLVFGDSFGDAVSFQAFLGSELDAVDIEHGIFFNAGTTPPFVTNAWFSIDVPFSSFLGLTTRGHLAQLILSGDTSTNFVDNISMYR